MKPKSIPLEYLGGCYRDPGPNPVWTLPSRAELPSGEIRGEMKTLGMWSIPVNYIALAMSCDFGPHSTPINAVLYGIRTLTNVRQSGYELEGTVSVNGNKYRGFTSSCLFQREDGSLVSVATIHVCISNSPTTDERNRY